MYARRRHGKRTWRQVEGVVRIPSRKLEYAYYVAIIYSIMAPAVGLDIPVVGGLMLLVISATCIWQFRSSFKAVYGPIALLLACATSFFFIQIFVHGQDIMDQNIRAFITWVFGLIIVQSLCLRQGFCLRFPLVLFVIGATTLPFVGFNPAAANGIEAARVDIAVQGQLTHPAGLADWFAFCAVFFTIFGIEARRNSFRIGAWSLAVVCLFVVTLTVERGPLLGAVLAITVGCRSVLKRSFVPVLALVILVCGGIAVTGLLDQAFSKYAQRGMEETGRETLWPEAIDRFLTSPLVGVGESNILLPLGLSKKAPPHNAFLRIALSSGVLPFAFFLAFWIQAARKSVFHTRGSEDNPFRLPYLSYTLVSLMIGDIGFMNYGGLLTISLAAGMVIPYDVMRSLPIVPARARPLVQVRRSRSRPVTTTARSRF
jgi:O-antigen ligase